MIIHDAYKDALKNTAIFSDKEFLITQIWSLKHVYCNECAAIKNVNLALISYTNQFASSFNLTEESLGHTFKYQSSISPEVLDEIEMQELSIIANKQFKSTIFNYTNSGIYKNYLMYKRPLINPSTNNVVGILIFSVIFDPMIVRKFVNKFILPKPKAIQHTYNVQLTEQQHFIITCLLLGFHSRKEIASILGNATNKIYSEDQIKDVLRVLYRKLNCENTNDIVNLISSLDKISLDVTGDILRDTVWTVSSVGKSID